MNARKLGALCALLAATPNLSGRESSRDSPDRQFQKQVKRAQECRELQDKLVGDQPLKPERAEEITKIMEPNVPSNPWINLKQGIDWSQRQHRRALAAVALSTGECGNPTAFSGVE
jgi:hypothetical protein